LWLTKWKKERNFSEHFGYSLPILIPPTIHKILPFRALRVGLFWDAVTVIIIIF
jgi:hypothetical protein